MLGGWGDRLLDRKKESKVQLSPAFSIRHPVGMDEPQLKGQGEPEADDKPEENVELEENSVENHFINRSALFEEIVVFDSIAVALLVSDIEYGIKYLTRSPMAPVQIVVSALLVCPVKSSINNWRWRS